jgi:hypothetical protein
VVSISSYCPHKTRGYLRAACFESGLVCEPSSAKLILCTEPELALFDLWTKCESILNNGDIILTLDLGGAYSTINTFQIHKKNRYILLGSESSIPISSSQIDNLLLSRFKNRYGREDYQYWCNHVPNFQQTIETKFSNLKKSYRGPSSAELIRIRVLSRDNVLLV